jgi:hypothetical protein
MMMVTLLACGGGSSNNSLSSATLSGNWQFTLAPQTDGNSHDPTFNGGLLGGFLLQNNGTASGQAVYSVTSSTSATGPCNSGSAPIMATVSGQNVTLTASAGTQTFTLTGTLSTDGSTMMGTYNSTAGTAPDASICGYAETGLSWSAISVPPLTGTIQGSFHSVGGTSWGSSLLNNQDFVVSGTLNQGENIGASKATVTGTLTFVDPTTNLSDYPCFAYASVTGEISGNSVILQVIGVNGSTVGQIGEPSDLFGTIGISPVMFDSVNGGYILHGTQPTYMVATSACPGSLGNKATAGDFGNICLALNNTTACQEPIILSPATITFPAQILESSATAQTITLANNSNSAVSGLMLSFANLGDSAFNSPTDFDGLPSFAETDACGANGQPSLGAAFGLAAGQSCSITITFAPQEGCPWLPFPPTQSPPSLSGAPPALCPFPQVAAVTANSPTSADGDQSFTVSITGTGVSAIQPSTPELDFGAEEQLSPAEASLPQMLSFTNVSALPVQILGRETCVNPQKSGAFLTLPSPREQNSSIAGLQVVGNGTGSTYSITADPNKTPASIQYRCDSDPGTTLPNFQIASDTCTGSLLAPQASCSVQVTYVPQPNTNIQSGLDYFLELNTVQCWPAGTLPSQSNPCEIDSGRFPVELKANTPSPLRMSPAAGLDFGVQATGKTSAPMTITLLNDPNLTYPQCTTQDCSTVTFVGKILVSGSYSESDDCPATLAQGGSCTITVTFKPGGVALNTGLVTINYSQVSNSGAVTLGNPQFVYLRGTGQ